MMETMNLGMPEMMFIFLLALIMFGPKRLPEIGRQIGKFMNEFRRASNEFKAQVEAEMQKIDIDASKVQEILPPTPSPLGSIANAHPVGRFLADVTKAGSELKDAISAGYKKIEAEVEKSQAPVLAPEPAPPANGGVAAASESAAPKSADA
jgi:sec-independent protein translocase protein TatB